MKCLSCKNDSIIDSTTSYFAHLANGYVIIENVPCKKCTQCGEEFFPTSVMERIDEIIAKIENISSKVCIIEYKKTA
ncbi:MAG: YgiT-type zinc finger protein [Spirochaetales bacterium]|nr:YgiT-type zinc finger protein [Spirochaetales bacterium]